MTLIKETNPVKSNRQLERLLNDVFRRMAANSESIQKIEPVTGVNDNDPPAARLAPLPSDQHKEAANV